MYGINKLTILVFEFKGEIKKTTLTHVDMLYNDFLGFLLFIFFKSELFLTYRTLNCWSYTRRDEELIASFSKL